MKSKASILIVDDDLDDREIIRDAFQVNNNENNYVFLESGDELLQYLSADQESDASLILLDLNMPGKDGRETLREIKKDDKLHHIPIIIFTTSSSQRDKKNLYDLGANCFVTKPDTFNKLVDLADSITKLWL